jgi:hypothetical protein
MNEIPIEHHYENREPEEYRKETQYMRGKDVIMDWEFDNFNTDSNLWIDSNGLDMHNKKLWTR